MGGVGGSEGVFGVAVGLVAGRGGEDEEEGEGGARDESEEVSVCQGVDVYEGELGGESEAVDQGGHQLGVTSGWGC